MIKRYKPLFDLTLIEQCKFLFFEKNKKKKKDKATFDRCIKHVIDQGKLEDSAYAICAAAGAGMKKKN